MKKLYTGLLALLIVGFMIGGAWADDWSVTNSSGDKVRITDAGAIVGIKADVESVSTNDTVTTAESGKTFLTSVVSGTVTFTLPTAVSGLNYTFQAAVGNNAAGQGTIILSPQSTDTFVGCVNSGATTTFAAGDDLDSPGVTGDAVTIVGIDTGWFCTNINGTWVDGDS